MNKSIYYTVPSNGSSYKLKITTNNPEHIDTLLDGINEGNIISKKQFDRQYKKLMTLEIRDEDSVEVIGYLTTEYMEDLEEDQKI